MYSISTRRPPGFSALRMLREHRLRDRRARDRRRPSAPCRSTPAGSFGSVGSPSTSVTLLSRSRCRCAGAADRACPAECRWRKPCPIGANQPRQPLGEIARARADVGDRRAWRHLHESPARATALLPLLAPRDRATAHPPTPIGRAYSRPLIGCTPAPCASPRLRNRASNEPRQHAHSLHVAQVESPIRRGGCGNSHRSEHEEILVGIRRSRENRHALIVVKRRDHGGDCERAP